MSSAADDVSGPVRADIKVESTKRDSGTANQKRDTECEECPGRHRVPRERQSEETAQGETDTECKERQIRSAKSVQGERRGPCLGAT